MRNDITRNFESGKLLFCGYEDCEPGHSYGPAVRDYYIIHFITSGKGTFFDEKREYKPEAGDGFLIVPSAVTRYCADEAEPWSYSWVAFEGEGIVKYLSAAGINAEHPVFGKLGGEAEQCFRDMRRHFDSDENECAILACMYRFLALIIERSDFGSIQKSYAERAAEFMKYNFHKGVGVNDAACFVGIDRAYLSKLFSENFGVSPSGYLLKLRMEEAARLLRNHKLRISDIAAGIGYSDQFVFSKAFLRYFGAPPSEYRRTEFLSREDKQS